MGLQLWPAAFSDSRLVNDVCLKMQTHDGNLCVPMQKYIDGIYMCGSAHVFLRVVMYLTIWSMWGGTREGDRPYTYVCWSACQGCGAATG
jgi:hypothetical protein